MGIRIGMFVNFCHVSSDSLWASEEGIMAIRTISFSSVRLSLIKKMQSKRDKIVVLNSSKFSEDDRISS